MSQQLTISSLVSAFALVCLCLFARSGDLVDPSANGGLLVQVQAATALGLSE